ncbi:MAG: DMT family transporter [Chlamydiae bacterium]|nr:DMT family transporter [Chlamydiota bacterium]
MLLSATGVSLIGLFGRFGIEDLSLSSLMFFRYFAAFSLLFLTFPKFARFQDLFSFRHFKLQFMRAFFVLLAQYSFFFYLEKNDLLNAAALLNTGPMFISLIEWGLLRKKVGVSSWVGAGVSFLGALFILQPNTGIFSITSLIGLLSGISQGASQVVFGLHSEKEENPALGVIHLFLLCGFLSFIPFVFSWSLPKHFSLSDFWIILAIAAASILNQFFRAKAYRLEIPSRLSAYLYFSVLLSGVWDFAVFHRIPNGLAIFGAALIILGGLLKIYLRQRILKKKN